jgi:hypothetical protein
LLRSSAQPSSCNAFSWVSFSSPIFLVLKKRNSV